MRWYQRFFRRERTEKRLDAELRFHLEQRIADLVGAGVAPEEARRQARLEFGGLDQVKEECRDAGSSHIIETFVQDLRYGLRQLRRNPGFTAVAVLTLALGIGANTAIFSVVDAVLLRNLPVRDPGRLVLFSDNPDESMSMSPGVASGKQSQFSYPFYRYVRDNNKSFAGVCAFQTPEDTLTVREGGQPGAALQVAQGKMVSGNYFSVLGVGAILGRTLMPADDQRGAAPVAVVSFNYWQTKLAGDREVVGKTFDIDGVPITIAGVAPRGFFGVRMKANSADFWMPLSSRQRLPFTVMPQAKGLLADPHIYWLNMMGRLKPGVAVGQAQADVNRELRQYLADQAGPKLTQDDRQKIEHAYVPLVPGGRGLSALRYQYAEPLRILVVIVGLVLLIACANVANLMLAQGTSRRKEMAMRLALGGSYSRLVRQLLTESMLLAALGAVAGAALAWCGVRILVAMVAAKVPLNVRPDLAVLAFAIGVTILAVVLSGLGPALRVARVDLVSALKAGEAPRVGERTRLGLSKSLVVFQIAASLLLMVGAGLLVHSLIDLEKQNLGFSPEGVLLIDIDPELAGYKQGDLPALYRELLDRINALPGVCSASIGMTSPMSGSWGGFDVSVEGEPQPAGNHAPQVVPVGPRYFQTEGMRIIAGRSISEQDTASSTPVAVVNQAFVRKFVRNNNPIGRRLSLGVPFKPPGNMIVGVVRDARFSSSRDPAGPMLFLSAFQLQSVMASVDEIEVRVAEGADIVTGEVRAAVRQIDPNLPITSVTTLSAQVDDSLGQQQVISSLTGFFGVLGLVLASVGLYGIMAYNVARRTHEIGVRMALGAEKNDVLRMVVGQGLRLVMIGLAVGVFGALGLTRFLSSLLYGIKPTDPLTFITVSLILIAVALLACYIPARRATKVDPMVALRYE
jgi:predicted permease